MVAFYPMIHRMDLESDMRKVSHDEMYTVPVYSSM